MSVTTHYSSICNILFLCSTFDLKIEIASGWFQYIETFIYICNMKRRLITFGRYFGEFLRGLTVKEREKVDYGLVL